MSANHLKKTANNRAYIFYACLLGFLTMIGPIAIDAFLPAVPAIAKGLNVEIGAIEYSLTAIFAGNALGQIIYGPLADRYGRKPIIVLALFIYFAATVGAGLASDVETLIFWRFLQGLVVASGRILSNAVARDLFEREKLAKLITAFMLIGAISTIGSSPLGGYLSENFHWRTVFWFMSGYSGAAFIIFLLFFKETIAEKDYRALRPSTLLGNFASILSNRVFLINVICGGFVLCGLVAYLNSSSGLLIGTFGIKPGIYGLWFSLVMIGYMAAAAITGKLIDYVGMRWLIMLGSFTVALSGMLMLGFALAEINHVLAIVGPMMLFMVGFAILLPQTTSASLTPFPRNAGAASSLQGFIQNSMAAVVSALLSTFADGSAIPMAVAIALSGLAAAATYVLFIRRL
tara:strand:- start:977 stop:2185 length:1209 start_codon:yes stop_codon:yes gene_type:complete